MRKLIVFACIVFTVADCYARGRIFGRRRSGNTYSSAPAHGESFSGDAVAVCQQKAALQARLCRMFHPGGSFGGGNYEGVGMASSAQAALNNCCYTGQRVCIGQAVCQGANGMFYACKIFR